MVLEKTLESPLDCKEIHPVHSEGDQPWDFFGRNDAKADTHFSFIFLTISFNIVLFSGTLFLLSLPNFVFEFIKFLLSLNFPSSSLKFS